MIRTAIAGIFSLNNEPLNLDLIARIIKKLNHRGRYIIWDITKNEVYDDVTSINTLSNKVFIQYYYHAQSNYSPRVTDFLIYAGYPLNLDKYIASWNDKLLRGYYAIARFDPDRDSIVLLRDRIGIKPLYYTISKLENIFAFASERKAIRNFGAPKRLLPGHKLIFSLKRKEIQMSPHRILEMKNNTYEESSEEVLASRLEQLLRKSIKLLGNKDTAILFSGGLDSTTLAVITSTLFRIKLFSAAFPNSRDYQFVRSAAQKINSEVIFIELNEKELETLIRETILAIEEYDPLKVSIGVPLLATLKAIRKHGYTVAFAGQGADELFGGYAKYLQAASLDSLRAMLYDDILHLAEKNLERDEHLAGYAGVDLRLPYLDDDIVDFALSLPIHLKVHQGIRKYILRLVARRVGVPLKIVSAPKKAIQYSTGTMKYLKKIAKKHQMNLHEYLKKIFHEFYGS